MRDDVAFQRQFEIATHAGAVHAHHVGVEMLHVEGVRHGDLRRRAEIARCVRVGRVPLDPRHLPVEVGHQCQLGADATADIEKPASCGVRGEHLQSVEEEGDGERVVGVEDVRVGGRCHPPRLQA